MPLEPARPVLNLITSGKTTPATTLNSPEFKSLLQLIEAAVASKVSLVQLREKQATTRVLQELACRAVELTRGSVTRLLVNDRFDVALASGADGVQLTSRSIPTDVVRRNCGSDFIVGVSTHSLMEAQRARDSGADFVLFGPVFETESKRVFGKPQGVERLREVARALGAFPVIAVGGVTIDNASQCFVSGAAGVAAISLLSDGEKLSEVCERIRQSEVDTL
jgi:thiamine-phosphate pyrophosphorylase